MKEVAAQEAQAAAAAMHAQGLQAERELLAEVREQMEAGLAAQEKQLHQASEKHQVWPCFHLPFCCYRGLRWKSVYDACNSTVHGSSTGGKNDQE